MSILDAPAAPALSYGLRLGAIGDSITANGFITSARAAASIGDGHPGNLDARNWHFWASMLTSGAVRFTGAAATGGYTTQQIRDTHLPTALASDADIVVVLAGTNDIGNSVAFSTTKANLTYIWRALARRGKVPVLCTLPPRNSDTSTQLNALLALNFWISEMAAANGWPLCNIHAVTSDTAGAWLSGYNADLVHPNAVGAKAMGQALATTLSAIVRPGKVALPTVSVGTGTNLYTRTGNPLFTDTNADGVPDGWSVASGSPTTAVATDNGNVVGNKLSVTRTAADAIVQASNTIPAAEGDKILIACRIKSTVESGAGTIGLRLTTPTTATTPFGLQTWGAADIPWSTLRYIVTCPSLGAENSLALHLRVHSASGAKIEVGQLLTRNLTADGYTL